MIFLFLLKDVLYEQIFNLLPQIKKRKIKNTNEFITIRTLVSISFQLFPLHSICNINHKCQVKFNESTIFCTERPNVLWQGPIHFEHINRVDTKESLQWLVT